MANSWNDNNVVHSTQFRLLAYFRSDILENYLLGVTIANGIISEGRVWYCGSRKSSKLEDNENAANLHGRIADLTGQMKCSGTNEIQVPSNASI